MTGTGDKIGLLRTAGCEPMTPDGTFPAICHLCHNHCGILATIEGGKVVKVVGDRNNGLSAGYTCKKGRAIPEFLGRPDRLLQPVKRVNGGHEPIGSEQAMDEIAERLRTIVDEHGPRSVAIFNGTYMFTGSPASIPTSLAFAEALGTPMVCDPNSFDQPGKVVAPPMHGIWMTPGRSALDSEVLLLVGANPLVSHAFGPLANPNEWVRQVKQRGGTFIVIDPRRTETAQRATIHMQPRPGQDIAILAAICKLILDEGLEDKDFLAENVDGVEALREAVAGYGLDTVAERAGVPREQLAEVARLIGSSRRIWAAAATGPNMAQSGTVFEYMLLVIQSLTGSWMRAGEPVVNPGTLAPQYLAIAQAAPPMPAAGVGVPMRVQDNFVCSIAGVQTALMPEEILTEGEGRVRALISLGGNPAACWPDQLKTIKALRSLDLLVQTDPIMSQTAQLADYVIAPKLVLETPQASKLSDLLVALAASAVRGRPWGQYVPARVPLPDGSDLLDDWEFLYGVAQRLGLQLTMREVVPWGDVAPYELDMVNKPTPDEMIDIVIRGGRVPLSEVKKHPNGFSDDPGLTVAEKQEGWSGRLDVGNADIMRDLRDGLAPAPQEDERPFRLISRRMMHVNGSTANLDKTNGGRRYNPAFMHPSDLDALHLVPTDRVRITSRHNAIVAIVEADPTVRVGCVSIAHNFGALDPEFDSKVEEYGSSVGRLLSMDLGFDRYHGQPRMSNIPVAVEKFEHLATTRS